MQHLMVICNMYDQYAVCCHEIDGWMPCTLDVHIFSTDPSIVLLPDMCGWGSGAFLRWWPPSAMWAGPLIFYGHHRECLNNPIFSDLVLCAVCWALFMCHYELWSTSVGHPLSFFNSSLGLTGGKHYQKITIAIFRFVPQNFTIPGNFH